MDLEKILGADDLFAVLNRAKLDQSGAFLINLMTCSGCLIHTPGILR
jgi:hypothetical protein